MKFTLPLLAAVFGLAAAAPAPEADAGVEARQIQTLFLTFFGADNDAKYDVAAPADGTPFTISEPPHLPISMSFLSSQRQLATLTHLPIPAQLSDEGRC